MVASVFSSDFSKQISQARDVSGVLAILYDSCVKIGGDKFSYHPEIMFEGVASARSKVSTIGFPAKWVEHYVTDGGKMNDPIPDVTMQIGRVMTWREALSNIDLDAAETDHVELARQYDLFSGLGFPLWGPHAQNAYAAIGFPDKDFELPDEIVRAEHMVLLAGHQKIQELVSQRSATVILSDRERQVLTWVAKGKSNNDVATILAISPDTVATYTRRIYRKLDSNDRVGATIKGLRLGLIRL